MRSLSAALYCIFGAPKKKKIGEDTANTFSSKPERVRAKAAFLAPEAIYSLSPPSSLSLSLSLPRIVSTWLLKRKEEK